MHTIPILPADEPCTPELIEQFCAMGIRESVRVEYKEDFPTNAKLAKTIAAFANTHGGLVFIGVQADSENRPSLPLTGAPFERGLEEKVLQIATQAIHPPVIPVVWVVPLASPPVPSKTMCVVVIRIEESNSAPHTVEDSKGVYLRTGSVSEPFEDRATIAQIQEMLGKREVSKRQREASVERFRSRVDYLLEGFISEKLKEASPGTHKETFADGIRQWASFEVSCTPEVPDRLLSTLPELRGLFERTWLVRASQNGFHELMNQGRIRLAQSSILQISLGSFYQIAEVSQFGLFGYAEVGYGEYLSSHWARNQPFHPHTAPRVLDAGATQGALLGILEFLPRYYSTLRFWGQLRLALGVRKAQGYALMDGYGHTNDICPDSEITIVQSFTVSQLDADLANIFAELFTSFCAAFGWRGIDSQYAAQQTARLREFVKKNA